MPTKMENGVFRTKRVAFTQVSNDLLHNCDLSCAAKGLYSLIESYITIPNFTLYKSFVKSKCKEGNRAFQTIWNELKDTGYLKQYKIRIPNGFMYEYELLDTPDTSIPATINVNLNGSISSIRDDLKVPDDTVIPGSVEASTEINTDNKATETKEQSQVVNKKQLEELKARIAERIELEYWKKRRSPYIENIYDIMVEVLTCPEETIKIGSDRKATAEVQDVFEKIDYSIIEFVLQCLDEVKTTSISNPKAYLTVTLYNAVKSMHTYDFINDGIFL